MSFEIKFVMLMSRASHHSFLLATLRPSKSRGVITTIKKDLENMVRKEKLQDKKQEANQESTSATLFGI